MRTTHGYAWMCKVSGRSGERGENERERGRE